MENASEVKWHVFESTSLQINESKFMNHIPRPLLLQNREDQKIKANSLLLFIYLGSKPIVVFAVGVSTNALNEFQKCRKRRTITILFINFWFGHWQINSKEPGTGVSSHSCSFFLPCVMKRQTELCQNKIQTSFFNTRVCFFKKKKTGVTSVKTCWFFFS